MPRTKSTVVNESIELAKELRPKDPDTKYIGDEPKFHEQPNNRNLAVITGLYWYNRFYGKKEAKEFLSTYLEKNGKASQAKKLNSVSDNYMSMPIGWLARLSLRGLSLNDDEKQKISNEVERLLAKVAKNNTVAGKKETTNRPNVQEIMKEKTREVGGDLEGLFDDFIKSGAGKDFDVNIIELVSAKNILPQHINILTDAWKNKQEEFAQLQSGKDEQLNEAYSYLSKTQVKNTVNFIDKVLSGLNGYVSVKKTSKAPRKRKPVSVEKLVSKLKYCREFKDPANKLDLVSISPTKLHGASEAWVYDSAKRKMHHYIADEYSRTFTVKGNTLLGFDEKQSEVKTLRKPNEQIKQLVGSKPAARKYFKDIKAVSTTPNGRFNPNMVILKAF